MSKKLTIEDWLNLVKQRNHKFINVSNPNYIYSGTITIKCFCGHVFTTSPKSYKNSKNGCPECKKISISQFWEGRIRKTEAQRRAISLARRHNCKKTLISQQWVHLKNKNDLINMFTVPLGWLKKNKNIYNDYILQKIKRQDQPTKGENHHIIPKHVGGPDVSWNLILLTVEEHVKAHELRLEVYNDPGDKAFMNFYKNPGLSNNERIQQRVKFSHETQKLNKTGFFSSEQQSLNGQKGGKKQTAAKIKKYIEKQNPIIVEKLKKGTIWLNSKTNEIIHIPGGLSLLYELQPFFAESFVDNVDKQRILNIARSTFTSSLSRVLKQERDSLYGITLIE